MSGSGLPAASPESDPFAEATPYYPGGECAPAYRLAFRVWIVFFLLIICIGLVIFLIPWVRRFV